MDASRITPRWRGIPAIAGPNAHLQVSDPRSSAGSNEPCAKVRRSRCRLIPARAGNNKVDLSVSPDVRSQNSGRHGGCGGTCCPRRATASARNVPQRQSGQGFDLGSGVDAADAVLVQIDVDSGTLGGLEVVELPE